MDRGTRRILKAALVCRGSRETGSRHVLISRGCREYALHGQRKSWSNSTDAGQAQAGYSPTMSEESV